VEGTRQSIKDGNANDVFDKTISANYNTAVDGTCNPMQVASIAYNIAYKNTTTYYQQSLQNKKTRQPKTAQLSH